MAHLERPTHHHLLYRLCELQQPQQIARRAARAADGIGRLLMGHPELVDEPLDGRCLLHRIQILALHVLDERHHQGCLVGHFAHDGRDLLEPRHLRGAPAPLAGDKFIAAIDRPHHDRLQHSLRVNGLGQLGERALIHPGSRLVAPGPDGPDTHRGKRLARRLIAPQQRIESPAEAPRLHAAAPRISLASARYACAPLELASHNTAGTP